MLFLCVKQKVGTYCVLSPGLGCGFLLFRKGVPTALGLLELVR